MHFAEIIILVTAPIIAFFCGYKVFQLYQLNSYRTRRVLTQLKSGGYELLIRFFALAFLSFVGMFVFFACFGVYDGYRYIGYAFYCVFGATFITVTAKEKKKTPLKFTSRVIRCAAVFLVLLAGFAALLVYLSRLTLLGYSVVALLYLLIPPLVVAAHVIMRLPESLNNRRYVKMASKKLDEAEGLIRIGITGSYGKTTAKNILGEMLRGKYSVFVSPSSFNTPTGIASCVNRGFSAAMQVFIAEMGARQRGDIKELAELVKPQYALITSVGKQHLETFGSQDGVVKTKFELIESLPDGGVAVFCRNCDEVEAMFNKCAVRKFLCGAENDGNCFAHYGNVTTGGRGTKFDLTVGGETVSVTTPLLGAHIPALIASCAVLALELGVGLSDIALRCASLEQIPHRLQLIENGDTLILDDAYNSNPEGARNALEILKTLDGAKIVITPGIVEQGAEQERINETLGEQIGGAADYAIFLGPNAPALKNGALKSMDSQKISLAGSLNEAVAMLEGFGGKKAVLFENDLPDNF